MKKRDGFMEMMYDAKAGKIDRIYTKSVSRFARNAQELLQCVDELKKYNVVVTFEKDYITNFKTE